MSNSHQIGSYKSISILGSGSYGVVRLALAPDGTRVAIKTIQIGTMRADRRELVEAEVNAMNRIQHQHVVALKEFIEEDFQVHIVMECAQGGDLLQYVNSKRNGLDEKEARRVFTQLCSAVDCAHRLGFIHRDLKLDNVLLDAARQVKLADWGYSAQWAPGARLTAALGSLHYAAPEICAGREYTGPEVDCWSLGVILFALMTGSLPFMADEEWQIYDAILSGTYTIPSTVPSLCASLIRSLLVVDPLRRATLFNILQHPWLKPSKASSTAHKVLDTTILSDRTQRRRSAGVVVGDTTGGGSATLTFTVLISFNDTRHELKFASPLSFKTLKKELKRRFGKVSIHYRPHGAQDVIPLQHEAEWDRFKVSQTTVVLLIESKTAPLSLSTMKAQQNILDTLPTAVLLTDQRGQICYANTAAERLFGYTTGELRRKNSTILMSPDVAQIHDSYLQRYLTRGTSAASASTVLGHPQLVRVVRKDKAMIDVRMRVSDTRSNSEEEATFTATFDILPPANPTTEPPSQPPKHQQQQQSPSTSRTYTPDRERPKKNLLQIIFG